MMKAGEAERKVVELLKAGENVMYDGIWYEIILTGKPTTPKREGEPKTDIYTKVRAVQSRKIREFKISFKKNNADFLENKITAERAKQIYGANWEEEVKSVVSNMMEQFNERPLVYFDSYRRTEKGAITLGWKFEFVNKTNGELSKCIQLTKEQILEVYSGSRLNERKRNAKVNDIPISNSGVATYMLVGEFDEKHSAQNVFDKIEPLESFCRNNKTIYAVCKALNRRTFKGKDDGPRPLGVYVIWSVKNNQLFAELSSVNPLTTKGDEMRRNLLEALEALGANNTDDLIGRVHPSVKVHK